VILIERWQTQFPKIKVATLKADNAESQIKCGNHKAALELYKEAVAILMPIVEGTVYHRLEKFYGL
jgi:hypothetical protein